MNKKITHQRALKTIADMRRERNCGNYSFKLYDKDLERIDSLIRRGIVLTRSEFYRQAVIWKVLDVFPVPDLFLHVYDGYDGRKKTSCSFKTTNEVNELITICGSNIEGGGSMFVRLCIKELLDKYDRIFDGAEDK